MEKAICASVPLAKADAEVDRRYREQRSRLAPAAAALLTKDERYFLAARERVFGYGMGEDDPSKFLLNVLVGRADFLRRLRVPPGEGLVGNWSSVAGLVTITPGTDGRLEVEINGNEPVTARWICQVQAEGQVSDGVLEIEVEDDRSRLRLRRDGQVLSVTALPPAGKRSWTPGYCGLNRSVEGSYFSVPPSR